MKIGVNFTLDLNQKTPTFIPNFQGCIYDVSLGVDLTIHIGVVVINIQGFFYNKLKHKNTIDRFHMEFTRSI